MPLIGWRPLRRCRLPRQARRDGHGTAWLIYCLYPLMPCQANRAPWEGQPFRQRADAALAAIWRFFVWLKAADLACPPLDAAARFAITVSIGRGSTFSSSSPMAIRATATARVFTSRESRFGILATRRLSHDVDQQFRSRFRDLSTTQNRSIWSTNHQPRATNHDPAHRH